MRISLLTTLATVCFSLIACSKSTGSGGGDGTFVSNPDLNYPSVLSGGKAYVEYGDFFDEAEDRLGERANGDEGFSLGLERKRHDEKDSCYSYTKHPIILVHGLYGFDDILGFRVSFSDPGIAHGQLTDSEQAACKALYDSKYCNTDEHSKGMKYWYNIVEAIELGGGIAIPVAVPKLNSTEKRGEHLVKQLENLNGIYGSEEADPIYSSCRGEDGELKAFDFSKFHIMGHSHGGPTVRYALEAVPKLLASVTTIGGLNIYGIPETNVGSAYDADDQPITRLHSNADDYLCTDEKIAAEEGKLVPGATPDECNMMADFMASLESFTKGFVYQSMLNGLAELIEFVGGDKQYGPDYANNGAASLKSLSSTGIAKFNTPNHPDDPTGRVTGLPEYHKLFLKDGALYGLGMRNPCGEYEYFSNPDFRISDDNFDYNVFGDNKEDCLKAIHGAPFANIGSNNKAQDEWDYNKITSDSIFMFSWSGTRTIDRNPFDPTDFLTDVTACLLTADEVKGFDDYVIDNMNNSFNKAAYHAKKFMCQFKDDLEDVNKCIDNLDASVLDKGKEFICEKADIVEPSDGMVQQYSSHFGTVLRSDYNLNHLDEMNWLFGAYPKSGSSYDENDPSFTPLAIYRIHANRLQQIESKFDL